MTRDKPNCRLGPVHDFRRSAGAERSLSLLIGTFDRGATQTRQGVVSSTVISAMPNCEMAHALVMRCPVGRATVNTEGPAATASGNSN